MRGGGALSHLKDLRGRDEPTGMRALRTPALGLLASLALAAAACGPLEGEEWPEESGAELPQVLPDVLEPEPPAAEPAAAQARVERRAQRAELPGPADWQEP
ncbi:MAG: hypothetical protein IT382_09210 [Deltaproteobacteria bacterium]|nr:hypothetical protein [Deltaproteobacteria bacterium]